MKTQGKDRDVVFLSGVRTPFGTFGGTLKDRSATDLAAAASRCAVERSGLQPGESMSQAPHVLRGARWVAVERELGLPRDKVNVHGGAIAIGHPLAASGARITIHLLHALRRSGRRFGLGSACIGGGQGAAVMVEAYAK